MEKHEIFVKVAQAIEKGRSLRIKTEISGVKETLDMLPVVQDAHRVYGFNRDGGSGTSIAKNDIVEIEDLV